MREIVAEDAPFERVEVSRDEAFEIFRELGIKLKLERLKDIPAGETITLYRHGRFLDLCRGPHVQRAGQIGAVKLLESSGVYFKGDEANERLQRIYGTAFTSKKELAAYEKSLEEARARDHRRLGAGARPLQLLAARAGLALLPPQGRGGLQRPDRLRARAQRQERLRRGGDAADPRRRALAHLRPLGELPREHVLHRARRAPVRRQADELPDPLPDLQGRQALLPRPADPLRRLRAAASLRAQRRDLGPDPGALVRPGRRPRLLHRRAGRGRSAARGRDHSRIYRTFEFTDVKIDIGDPPGEVESAATSSGRSPKAALKRGARANRGPVAYTINAGDGAFYGPKIDFRVKRRHRPLVAARHRAARLPAAAALRPRVRGRRRHIPRPVMIHRAMLGSVERFLGILIEHTAGAFPFWLAPVQAKVLPVSEKFLDYARGVPEELAAARPAGRARRVQREARLQDPPGAAREGALHAGGGGQRGRAGERSPCACGRARIWARSRSPNSCRGSSPRRPGGRRSLPEAP